MRISVKSLLQLLQMEILKQPIYIEKQEKRIIFLSIQRHAHYIRNHLVEKYASTKLQRDMKHMWLRTVQEGGSML